MQSVQETRTNVTKFRAAWFEHLSAPAVREIPEAGSMQDIKAMYHLIVSCDGPDKERRSKDFNALAVTAFESGKQAVFGAALSLMTRLITPRRARCAPQCRSIAVRRCRGRSRRTRTVRAAAKKAGAASSSDGDAAGSSSRLAAASGVAS